jgi:hypothetical protein
MTSSSHIHTISRKSALTVQQLLHLATSCVCNNCCTVYSQCRLSTSFERLHECVRQTSVFLPLYKHIKLTFIILWKTAKRRATCESLLYIYTRVRQAINSRNRATNFPDSVTTSLADLLPANSYIKYNYTPRQYPP